MDTAAKVVRNLPVELLVHILSRLAPADLVVCRAVCTAWRDVVVAIAARDRRFAYRCGWADTAEIEQPYRHFDTFGTGQSVGLACTCGAVVSNDLHHMVFGPETGFFGQAAASSLAGPYAARHDLPLPPARWELLAHERSLAVAMTQHAARMGAGFLAFDYQIQADAYSCTWVPSWLHLPDGMLRPTTTVAMARLVGDVVFGEDRLVLGIEGAAALLERLASSPAVARDYYARGEQVWATYYSHHRWTFLAEDYAAPVDVEAEWRDAWRLQAGDTAGPYAGPDRSDVDESDVPESFYAAARHKALRPIYRDHLFRSWVRMSDPSGWSLWQLRARTVAATWHLLLRKGWRALLSEHLGHAPWGRFSDWAGHRTDGELRDAFDGIVAAADEARRAFEACCTLPVVVHGHGEYWVGGLSPAGHLVGTLTTCYES